MADQHTSEDIERQLEQDRAGLADTLDDLKEKFSLESIIRQAAGQFREHGGDIGASVGRAVKDNPMALALTGVGLAWLIFSDKSGAPHQSERDYERNANRDRDRYRGEYSDRTRDGSMASERNGGYSSRTGMTAGFSDTNVPSWARDVDESHLGKDTNGEANTGRSRTSHGGAGDNASYSADSRQKSGVQQAAAAVRDRAVEWRDRLAEGTEQLTEEGRERVIAARERVYEARRSAMDLARRGQDRAVDMFDEQPLIAGALALAVGVAIGAALPRTRFEDEHFGAQSDELIREAERIYSEERAKIGAVAGAAMDEARDIANETRSSVEDAANRVKAEADRNASGGNAAQDMADKAKGGVQQAGQRIADAAKAEADKQNLGKIQS